MELRLVSLMAENMKIVYRQLAGWLGRSVGVAIEVEDRVPWQEREKLLDRGEAHVGFVCGFPYVQKVDRPEPLVELLAAPVMRHPRYRGEPIYFSDVVVRAHSSVRSLEGLRRATWAYNEPRSHSGYILPRYHLATLGERSDYFNRVVESVAHQESLRMVAEGAVDASAIDSTVLELETKLRPHLVAAVRIIHTLGPSPAPPAVVSTKLQPALRGRLRRALLSMHNDPAASRVLASVGIAQFARVCDADYDPIRNMARVAQGVRWKNTAHDRERVLNPLGGRAAVS